MRRLGPDIDRAAWRRAFGDRLRMARVAASKSQGDLGDLIGVVKQQISHVETGRSTIDAKDIEPLAKALGVKAVWLLTGQHSEIVVVDEAHLPGSNARPLTMPDIVARSRDKVLFVEGKYDKLLFEAKFTVEAFDRSIRDINPGDRIVFDRRRIPKLADIVLALPKQLPLPIIRRFVPGTQGSINPPYRLTADNADFAPTTIETRGQCRIAGVAIEHIRSLS